MKKFTLPKKEGGMEGNHIAFWGGTYSLAMTVLVLAILIVVNILVSALPATWTKFDMSAAKLYSITSNTKAVVNALEEDVTIYWIVQSQEEDEVIENLLNKSKGDYAYTIIDCNEVVADEVVAKLEGVDGVLRVRCIK